MKSKTLGILKTALVFGLITNLQIVSPANSSTPSSDCTLTPGSYVFFHPGAAALTQSEVYRTVLTIISDDHFILESNWGIDWMQEFDFETARHQYRRQALPGWMTNKESCEDYPRICKMSLEEKVIPVLEFVTKNSYSERELLPIYLGSPEDDMSMERSQGRCLLHKLASRIVLLQNTHEAKKYSGIGM